MNKFSAYQWAFFVANRYLFSKKSHNTINIITMVSMCGVAIGTMALICVLSILNGFESMVNDTFTAFDSDLRVELKEGKFFDCTTQEFKEIKSLQDIAIFSEIVSSNALAEFEGRQTPIQVKGVSSNYNELTGINDLMIDGKFRLNGTIVSGIGVANTLNLGISYESTLTIYAPKRFARVNLARPDQAFRQEEQFVTGIFACGQAEYDDKLIFTNIALARDLFDCDDNEVTSIEIRLTESANSRKIEKQIQQILGDEFNVLNRHEQQADFYRILQIEKWITFLILAFILFIATCNIIGSLSMLMINKKEDIALFYSLGAHNKNVEKLFLIEGWLIAIYGAIGGVVLGVGLCLAQQYIGILKMGVGYVVENYPVDLQTGDIILTFFTVIILGFVLAAYPAALLRKRKFTIKE